MKFTKLLIPILFAFLASACGGGGSSSSTPTATTTAVSLSGQVYDQGVANASVTVYIGDQAVAHTTTDQNGNYSVNLQVTEASRASHCVVVATRGNISLRSLLGNMGAITDIATANGGKVTSTDLPSANVTNVSTALAAVIENTTGGTLPDSQADIDAAVHAIATDANAQDRVIKIAAAIKAVVDYSGDPSVVGAATNTDELAKVLAASADLAGDLDTVVASSSASSAAQLELEVAGDPTLAEQIPSDAATLVASLAGNTYVTGDPDANTLLAFRNGGAVTIAGYSDIETGGVDGTYTDNQDGTLTIVSGGTNTIDLTVIGGSANAILTNVVINGTDEGTHVLLRIVPVVTSASSATAIGAADLAGKTFVDVATSRAVVPGTCDATGSVADSSLLSAQGTLPGATCQIALGMIVISQTSYGKMMLGALADSWDGTALSQQMGVIIWEANPTPSLGDIASYGRVYQPIDWTTTTPTPIQLRLYPDSGDGSIGAQLRFVTVNDTPGDTAADGKMDVYNYLQGTYSAKTVDLIMGTQHPLTGTLLVNGSVYPGVIGTTCTDWATCGDPSVSIGINLGKNVNGGLQAHINPNYGGGPRLRTRYAYGLSTLTADDVSGKTFTVTDLIHSGGGTVTFNANGSGVLNAGTSQSENFTWAIGPAVPANATTSGVTDYGDTLVLTGQDGSRQYLFGHHAGDAMITAGYIVDASGSFQEVSASVVIPQ
ncbi:MAG: hypothetical protein P8019_17115 [Gammaproteobacteria bacterium]